MLRSCPEPSPAILELHDIVVTLATPSADDKKHNALESYEYKGRTSKDEVACWVPVVPGSRFCVHVAYNGVSPPQPNAGLQFQVFMDGRGPVWWAYVPPTLVAGRVRQIVENKEITVGDVELTGREIEGGLIQHFCFSIRQTTDNGEDTPPPNLNSFGQIKVLVWWAVEDPDIEKSELGWTSDTSLLSNTINEKFKKVEHRCAAGLDQAEVDPNSDARIKAAPTRPLHKKAFVFKFQYRDAEWFKAEQNVQHTSTKRKTAREPVPKPPTKRRKETDAQSNRCLKDEPLY
ncbi:hypothetical protein FRC08_007668 [Ceratobasidium sp. 394]|nr:hypothetical protein FRC08_007668 [Ceratobasidium sp. 394]KAG9087584.1 hypothetical protein FS749_002831 [Ceratobasidium sp. UAMH 11750]